MKLVCGLGNPGIKYSETRHNIGFMVLDAISAVQKWSTPKEEASALTWRSNSGDDSILWAKPQTFMNRSGDAVLALSQFYKIPASDILVVHDEVDLPFGSLRFHTKRSPGGNNGIKDIHLKLGTNEYHRLRLGVGRPPNPQMAMADWVLQKFSDDEVSALPAFIETASKAVMYYLEHGFLAAGNKFHTKEPS